MEKDTISHLFVLILIFIFGELLFLVGFFPLPNRTSSPLLPPTKLDDVLLKQPKPAYNRTVLMLVDALRYDFLESGAMPYSAQHACYRLHLKADAPTVTLPRIKSLSTGTISNFLDIVLNLGNIDELDDSVLHRLKSAGRKLVLAGDHTWLKLHPNEFVRHEANTQSLFVNDFYESDEVVHKAIKSELNLNDWNFLIAHYLGLDHIGHVEGTDSAKIPSKLKEMDDMVQYIHNLKYRKNMLLLLTADHGMRNGGGHGGNSHEETDVPLFVFKENCLRTGSAVSAGNYNQIDLAVTIAILNGIEIPPDSIGCIITEFIEDWSLENQLYAYFYNAQHLLDSYKKRIGISDNSDYLKWYHEAKVSHKQYLSTKSTGAGSVYAFENAKRNYQRLAKELSIQMSKSLVHFDFMLITSGVTMNIAIVIYILVLTFLRKGVIIPIEKALMLLSLITGFVICIIFCLLGHLKWSEFKSWLFVLPFVIITYLIVDAIRRIYFYVSKWLRYRAIETNNSTLVSFGFFAFSTLSLSSSSFIEEEHQTWYYLGPSMMLMLMMHMFSHTAQEKQNINIIRMLWQNRLSLLMLCTLAFLRRLNQTGDKWKHLQDIGDILGKPENKLYLSLLTAFGLAFLLFQIIRYSSTVQVFFATLALIQVYCYNALNGKLHLPFPDYLSKNITFLLFWFSLAFYFIWHCRSLTRKANFFEARLNFLQTLETNLCLVFMLSALLHKPHNIILLPTLHFTLSQLYGICEIIYAKKPFLQVTSKVLLTIVVSNMFYFYQGNSNSLATVDVNPGYIGQTQHIPLLVASFVALNSFGTYVLAFQYMIINLLRNAEGTTKYLNNTESKTSLFFNYIESTLGFSFSLYTALTMLPVAYYLVSMIVFRYHLFIYTVFSPKALYECFDVVMLFLNILSFNLVVRIYNLIML